MQPNKPEPSPAPDDAFIRAITAYGAAAEQGNAEQAESAALEAFMLAAQRAEKNPSPDLELMKEATACEERGDWPGAESRYRQLVALAEASAGLPQLCQANLKLCQLLLLLERFGPAGEYAAAASAAARRADISSLQVVALETQATCALRRSDLAGALQAATEAVGLVEAGRQHDHLRAGAWVSRARCLVALGDETGAERELASSKPILLEREISPFFAGVHSKVAGWLEVAGSLCALRGEVDASVENWSRAVERRRHVASLPQVAGPHTLSSLARTLVGLAKALEAAGRPVEAKGAFDEARNIRHEIGIYGEEHR
jgi:tetratricopeptide (TPR) repeat protein